MNKTQRRIWTVILIVPAIFIVTIIVGCMEQGKSQKPERNLFTDFESANAVAWIAPHADDDLFAAGALALASLGYNKKTYVFTNKIPANATFVHGTTKDRLKDNQDIKNFLNLTGYIYKEIGEYGSIPMQKIFRSLHDFVSDNNIDLIITFENTHGYNGHPQHIQLSKIITKFSKKNNIKLYYLINRDPRMSTIPNMLYGGSTYRTLDPLPFTDVIDLDEHRVIKNGKSMSLWDIKVGVFEIYSSSVLPCYNLMHDPDELAEIVHKEYYRKVR